MKLKYLLESFEFDDFFPSVVQMYPNARRHKQEFRHAYDLLVDMRPTPSNKNIRYTLIKDEVMGDSYFGANDQNFRSTWDVLLGKEVKKDKGVDLTEEEIVANCLINVIFLGKHPAEYEQSYLKLTRGR
ncbi:MAG: hypothetical protein IKH22_01245 [Prevotella sp.]|jgi:hypothetical protein|nr:hypothetical protein [Prevotella sp.]